jgi:hypothetical protein
MYPPVESMENIIKFVNAKLNMKELKCERCGELYVRGHLTGTDEYCEQCLEEIEADTPDEPDMSGADSPGEEGNR